MCIHGERAPLLSFHLALSDTPTTVLAPLASYKSITAIKVRRVSGHEYPYAAHSRQGSLIHSGPLCSSSL